MELLYYALNLFLNLDFALKQFGERAHYSVVAGLDCVGFFPLNFPEEFGGNLLASLRDNEVD